MVSVPTIFQQRHPFCYPKWNKKCFEEWYFDNYSVDESWNREYLPVFWTGYYVKHNFGNDQPYVEILQFFIDSLPRNIKYYTIVQYDNGPLVDFKDLDIKVFAMSGPKIDYCLPLIYEIPKSNFQFQKQFFCNCVVRETHPIRNKIFEYFKYKQTINKYYITSVEHSPHEFFQILARSIFTLCPRGYGATSFRILESISQGSIPVYISDEFLIPHNYPFKEYGVLIPESDIDRIDDILTSFTPEQVSTMQDKLRWAYEELYTYEANKKLILKIINKQSGNERV